MIAPELLADLLDIVCGNPAEWEEPLWVLLEITWTGWNGFCTHCGREPIDAHRKNSSCRAANILRVLKAIAEAGEE